MGSAVRTRSGPGCLWHASPTGNRTHNLGVLSIGWLKASTGTRFNRLRDFRLVYPMLLGPTFCTSYTVRPGFVRIFFPSGFVFLWFFILFNFITKGFELGTALLYQSSFLSNLTYGYNVPCCKVNLCPAQVWAGEVWRAGDPGLQRLPASGRQGSPPLQVCPLPPLPPQRRLQVQTLCRQNTADQPGKRIPIVASWANF